MNLLSSCEFDWRRHRLVGCVLSILTAFFAMPAFGQGQFAVPTYSAPSRVAWISGPDTARLGTVARMEIPAGYRLMDKDGARAMLERTGNPVPEGLVGILAPESGQWWAVLEFTPVGYLKDVDKEALDAATILQAMQPFINPLMLQHNLDRLPEAPTEVASLVLRSLAP